LKVGQPDYGQLFEPLPPQPLLQSVSSFRGAVGEAQAVTTKLTIVRRARVRLRRDMGEGLRAEVITRARN
jgi:hypothetical protein